MFCLVGFWGWGLGGWEGVFFEGFRWREICSCTCTYLSMFHQKKQQRVELLCEGLRFKGDGGSGEFVLRIHQLPAIVCLLQHGNIVILFLHFHSGR